LGELGAFGFLIQERLGGHDLAIHERVRVRGGTAPNHTAYTIVAG
jgi:hypothetical protein